MLLLNIRYSSDLQKFDPKDPRFGIRTQRSCHLYYSHGGGGRWLFNNGTFAWSSHNRGTLSPCKDAGCRPHSPSFLSLEDKFPDKLRLSIVRPMLKEGNEWYCNKYRPIRLVSSNVHKYYIEKALWMSCGTSRRYVKYGPGRFGLQQVYSTIFIIVKYVYIIITYEFEAEHNGHVNILIWRPYWARLFIDLRLRGYFEWVRFQVSSLRYLPSIMLVIWGSRL